MRSIIATRPLSDAALELQLTLRARGMDDVADELLLAHAEPGLQAVKIIGVPSVDPPIFGAQYPVDHPYASGKAINLGVTPLGAGAQVSADIVTAGYLTLEMFWRIGNATTPATAAGDAAGIVVPYEDDDVTGFPLQIAPEVTPRAAGLGGNFSCLGVRYTLGGISKVLTRLTNNNVAALQGATAIYFLQK